MSKVAPNAAKINAFLPVLAIGGVVQAPPSHFRLLSKITPLGQTLDRAFNEADNAHDPAEEAKRQQGNQQHDEAFFGVAENELVHTESPEKDSEDASGDFLRCVCVCHNVSVD